jgi:hypothetical protein
MKNPGRAGVFEPDGRDRSAEELLQAIDEPLETLFEALLRLLDLLQTLREHAAPLA